MSTEDNEIQAAIEAGLAQAEPHQLGMTGRFYSVTVPAGAGNKVIDLEELLDKYRHRPRRKTGTVVVHDADSFATYHEKHGVPESELYADLETRSIVAVLNAHGPSEGDPAGHVADDVAAGWGDHRVQLQLKFTPAWNAWAAKDRKMMTQLAFAEHIEDQVADIIKPAGADMLEIAQTLSVNRDVKFESSQRLSTGERKLAYRENDDAKAGKRGELAIPERFELGLVPFEGGTGWEVAARLRYRIENGALMLGYYLDRPDDILRNAFNAIREDIASQTGARVLSGKPIRP